MDSSAQPLVKLTKSGKPRKPYVMTPARKEAFERCKLARLAKYTSSTLSSESLPERIQLAKDQANRIDSAMGASDTDRVVPQVAPPKPILTRTPTQSGAPKQAVRFAGKEKPIPVRKTTPKRADLDIPGQPAPVSTYVESTEADTEMEEEEEIEIPDNEEEEVQEGEETERTGGAVEDSVMDIEPAPEIQKHTPRKMKKEKVMRIEPRLYRHVRQQLMQPPKSFLEDEDEEEEEEDDDVEERDEVEHNGYEEDDEESVSPVVRAPGKRRAISTTTGVYARPHALGNSIRPSLVWSKRGRTPTHIIFV
jgi:hypothetical protein